MECHKTDNMKNCNCSYPCSRKGECCSCIKYHRERNELPACYFTAEAERTYDRSISNYIRTKRI